MVNIDDEFVRRMYETFSNFSRKQKTNIYASDRMFDNVNRISKVCTSRYQPHMKFLHCALHFRLLPQKNSFLLYEWTIHTKVHTLSTLNENKVAIILSVASCHTQNRRKTEHTIQIFYPALVNISHHSGRCLSYSFLPYNYNCFIFRLRNSRIHITIQHSLFSK